MNEAEKRYASHFWQHIIIKQLEEIDKRYFSTIPSPSTIYEELKEKFQDKLVIPFADFSIATACSLQCRGCSQWMPYLHSKRILSKEEIHTQLQEIFRYIDYIHILSPLGGEAFLNPDFPEIMEELLELKQQGKIGYIRIVTNGTIYPNERTKEVLRNPDILLLISNYEGILEPKQQENCDKLREFLEEENCRFFYPQAMEWTDLGIPGAGDNLREEVLEQYFESCFARDCAGIYEGNLYHCPRSYALENMGKAVPRQEECIRFREIHSREEMAERLAEFYSLGHLSACAYCNPPQKRGRIRAAEQIDSRKRQDGDGKQEGNKNMEKKISKALTIYVPGNLCNFRCSYCYVSECMEKEHIIKSEFHYPMEHMLNAFRPERIGGYAYMTVIGNGETLLPEEVVPFVKGLLHQGHVVEVVTNNTLNDRIEELLDMPAEDLERLIVKGSLHWHELKRLNKVEDYFANMKKVLAAGASSYPFLVICDDYLPDLDEICERCEAELGVLPQCTPCVVTENQKDFFDPDAIVTSPVCTPEFVKQIDDRFHSKLFMESVRFLKLDPRELFCYMGKWGFCVGMGSGMLAKCHNAGTGDNFYDNISEPIGIEPIGCECQIASCSLQYQYFGMGMIPEIAGVPSYMELLDREGLFTDTVRKLMGRKISETEQIMTEEEKLAFCMKQIHKKNEQIEECRETEYKLAAALKQCSEAPVNTLQDKEQLFNELMDMVDSGRIDAESAGAIRYEHLKALEGFCLQTDNGAVMLQKIISEIIGKMMDTYCFGREDILVLGKNEQEWENAGSIPISVLLTDRDHEQALRDALAGEDKRAVTEKIISVLEYIG